MSEPEENEYLLGTGDEELARLEFQHNVFAAETDALLDEAAFAPGSNLLDLGAGPGFTSLALAQRVGPSGKVLAVDTSDRFAGHLRRLTEKHHVNHVDFLLGDVHHLDLAARSFDGALARWLFCFLADPEAVIQQVAELLKPGGRFTILDYFNYKAVAFLPKTPLLVEAFQATHRSFADSGGNLDIGDKLPEMLVKNGFSISALQPICSIARPGEPCWRWFQAFRKSYYPKMVEAGYLSAEEADTVASTLQKRENEPGNYFFPPPLIGIVATRLE